ncbi:hypothetical protein LZL87_012131 [Fusarium oxysporum]|nr:hypothetical protein LZL87_012131 [Fusarium oxysporum]
MMGKSTTTALQFVLNPVYTAWSTAYKKCVSILSIDIKRAYYRVDLEFVASFLSNRSTVVKLPDQRVWINIGIPQGSPLSPILFLLFTALQLLMVSKKAWKSEAPKWLGSVQFYCFAFVDDTYIMVVSSSYRINCRALEFAHEEILKWAKPTVNIEGFDTKNEPVNDLKILGVIFDRRLRWTAHGTEIEAKVERQLAILARFSGSVWGPSLADLVKLYTTKIRTTITYTCPAWFIYGDYESLDLCLSGFDEIQWAKEHGDGKPKWSFPKYNLERLQKLQYKCLLRISGALQGTCARVLEKELVVDDIEVTLTRHVMTHRAKILDTPEYELLATVQSDLTQSGTSTRGN